MTTDAMEPSTQRGMVVPSTENQQEIQENQMVSLGVQLFQSVPVTLASNRTSRMNVEFAIKNFKAKVAANNGKMSPELDLEANNLIVKIKKTIDKMKGQREPFTQIVDKMSSIFTRLEAEVKAFITEPQKLRNDWAKYLQEEEERQKKEAAQRAEINTAKAQLSGLIIETIGRLLNTFLFTRKEGWTTSFNSITLENFVLKEAGLRSVRTDVTQMDIDAYLTYTLPSTPKLDEPTRQEIKADTHSKYDFASWIKTASQQLAEHKQGLIDRLPSKKAELNEAAELERQRQEEAERKRLADIETQKQLAKAQGEEKARLEEQQRLQQIEDNRRAEELKAEQEKLAKEKAEREAEEKRQMELQREEADKKAQETGSMVANAGTAQSLFQNVFVSSGFKSAAGVKTTYEITVLSHAGYSQLFEFWYKNKGVKMSLEEAGKATLPQMKKFAEDRAKEGEFIVQIAGEETLKYEKGAKAINKALK